MAARTGYQEEIASAVEGLAKQAVELMTRPLTNATELLALLDQLDSVLEKRKSAFLDRDADLRQRLGMVRKMVTEPPAEDPGLA